MCTSCEAVKINGVLCHETGCPSAWTKAPWRQCKCGTEFQASAREFSPRAEAQNQRFCSDDCAASYNLW